jgi:hypothetical protein
MPFNHIESGVTQFLCHSEPGNPGEESASRLLFVEIAHRLNWLVLSLKLHQPWPSLWMNLRRITQKLRRSPGTVEASYTFP